ncbi:MULTISPECIES: dTMP kinase [Bartonella]|uniref:Thymidylate kinase n=1 Tax=Bartonella choladocola TaxID=2750995 RepID=A0A1U9MHA6_9HYPH|nr:dTMP kinase [Bartonella choladocola]AQT47284.1 thymidylate kinase [Bartonella choladocola]MBH9975450.1 dTMP kinase [Bartonella choladocola]MBI0015057.1 dTMP kinase [Bartonella sp. B10834G3]MBI0140637.1 dTMP kinase [Bartonella choladocola]
MSGYFFTFEGGEGAGKSTQINIVGEFLKQKGYEVVVTREPGGTTGSEAIRYVLLSGNAQKMGRCFEAVLFAAARIDHINEVIAPALKQGKIVLCDRFIDSTRVYQGDEKDNNRCKLELLEKTAIVGYMPDITFILDLPAKIGMARADKRREKTVTVDRFEKDDLAVQEARRQAFLEIAAAEPERCRVINANRNIDEIAKDIEQITLNFLKRKNDAGN